MVGLDLRGVRERALAVVAHELLGDVDDPAGAGDEVGHEQDVPRRRADPVGTIDAELVVGRADDRPALQLRDRRVVEHVAERARREDVALRRGAASIGRRARRRPCAVDGDGDAIGEDIRSPTTSAPSADEQVDAAVRPDMADPDHVHGATASEDVAVELLQRGVASRSTTPYAVTGDGSPDPPDAIRRRRSPRA